MVDRKDPLPVTRQCALLDLPRSTFYHVPKPVSDEELELMALIDRCHLKHPFYGSRRIRDWLEDRGYRVNRKKVRRLMRTMGLVAQYPKRNLSFAKQDYFRKLAALCPRNPRDPTSHWRNKADVRRVFQTSNCLTGSD